MVEGSGHTKKGAHSHLDNKVKMAMKKVLEVNVEKKKSANQTEHVRKMFLKFFWLCFKSCLVCMGYYISKIVFCFKTVIRSSI